MLISHYKIILIINSSKIYVWKINSLMKHFYYALIKFIDLSLLRNVYPTKVDPAILSPSPIK